MAGKLDLTVEFFYKGLLASIKLELVNTQHFIDYYEVLAKRHPECDISESDLKRYREFLHWWLRKIDKFKRGQPLEEVMPIIPLPPLSLFQDKNSPIPHG